MTDTGKVIPLHPVDTPEEKPKRKPKGRPCPEALTDKELRRLLELCAREGFSLEEVRYGWMRTKLWWETRRQLRTHWHLVCLNNLLSGGFLTGFPAWCKRTRRLDRNGQPVRTRITPEKIDEVIARRKAP